MTIYCVESFKYSVLIGTNAHISMLVRTFREFFINSSEYLVLAWGLGNAVHAARITIAQTVRHIPARCQVFCATLYANNTISSVRISSHFGMQGLIMKDLAQGCIATLRQWSGLIEQNTYWDKLDRTIKLLSLATIFVYLQYPAFDFIHYPQAPHQIPSSFQLFRFTNPWSLQDALLYRCFRCSCHYRCSGRPHHFPRRWMSSSGPKPEWNAPVRSERALLCLQYALGKTTYNLPQPFLKLLIFLGPMLPTRIRRPSYPRGQAG